MPGAAALSFGRAGGAWAPQSVKCGNNVSQQGKIIAVKPTGIDDTANLQCAIDLALSGGRGSVVQLTRGKFYTAQLVAADFKGTIRGEGMNKTILQNLPSLVVKNDGEGQDPLPLWVVGPPTPPSGDNPWPVLLSFVNGDIAVRDLAIQIVGAEPTTGWNVPGFFPIKAMSSAILVVGSRADLRVSRIALSSELAPNDLNYGFNVYNGILSQGGGFGGSPSPTLAGLYEVRDSRFTTVGFPVGVATLKNADVIVEGNTYGGAVWAMSASGLTNTNVRFVNNNASIKEVKTPLQPPTKGYGIYVTNFDPDTFTNSRLFIAHNTLKGEGTAIGVDATFNGKTGCHLLLNDTRGMKNLPTIVLAKGTKDCLVVTRETNTVKDEGDNNRIITVPRR
jgi:hypothetical protein